MKFITLALLALLPAFALAGSATETAPQPVVSAVAGDAINTTCPISKKAVDSECVTEHAGKRIAFCCGNCKGTFDAWAAADKDAYVKATLVAQETKPAAEAKTEWKGDPYTVTTCPVSGEKLGSMGDPISQRVEGREVKLCCKGCISKLEADPAKFIAVLDKAIIADQLNVYPSKTCLISGEPLEEEGKDIGVNVVAGNRLFRVCCKMCAKKVKADPGKYVADLDKLVMRAQGKAYPLTTCPISGEELGDASATKQVVVANRLIKLCCGRCEKAVAKDPSKAIAALDRAWAATKKK